MTQETTTKRFKDRSLFLSLWLAFMVLFPVNTYAEDCAVLLHGMARTEKSMRKLADKLREADYIVVNRHYPSTKQTVEELAITAIDSSISECPNDSKVDVVTHSLGGILIRYYMENESLTGNHDRISRVVMLAPPNKGSQVADKMKGGLAYQWFNGPVGQQLGTDAESMPSLLGAVDFELGVIAGSRSINLILSTMLPNPDDGKVSVENTKVEGMADHIVLPVSHPFIMRNDAAITQTLHFLKTGKFDHQAIEKQ